MRVVASCGASGSKKVWRKVVQDAEPVVIKGFEQYRFAVGRAFTEVDGKPTVDPDLWGVTERTTGFLVAGARETKEAAIKAAEDKLYLAGRRSLDASIKKASQILKKGAR